MTLQIGDKRTINVIFIKRILDCSFLTMICLDIDAPVEGYTLFVLWITLIARGKGCPIHVEL